MFRQLTTSRQFRTENIDWSAVDPSDPYEASELVRRGVTGPFLETKIKWVSVLEHRDASHKRNGTGG